MLKNSFIAFVLLALYGCSSSHFVSSKKKAQDSTEIDLYILAGQSNMAGRGKIDSLSKVINLQIMMFTKDGHWVPATDPVHFDKPIAGVGPGIAFATAMLAKQKNKDVRIGLIPCAVGGTSIDAWQKKGFDKVTKTYPYDAAIEQIKKAMPRGRLKGIIWHQGGSDNTPEQAVMYMDKLKKVIDNFRNDLGMNIPFVAGELGNFRKLNVIDPLLKELPRQVPNTAVVSADGLTHIGDNTHFDTRSARILGKRYAKAMLVLLHK